MTKLYTKTRANDWNNLINDDYDYMKTIEHNLNVAIYYTAATMNKVMESYEGCECKGDEEDDGGNEISGKYLQLNALFAMLTIGSFVTSIFAVSWFSIVSKVKNK